MQEKQDKQQLTLKCLFTEEEKTQMAREMAQKTLEKDTIQQTMKETQAQFKAKIEACETIIKRNATYIKDGYEYRSVDCVVDYNTPESSASSSSSFSESCFSSFGASTLKKRFAFSSRVMSSMNVSPVSVRVMVFLPRSGVL